MKGIVSIVVAVVVITATTIFHVNRTEDSLIVKSGKTGEIFARYPLEEGGEFSVGFKHSVNKSLVEDRYKIENGEIVVFETLYYHFGAGVQTQLQEGQTLEHGKDGSMVIGNINQVIPKLYYNISPVYDHTLKINGETISLQKLCQEERNILFSYKP